MFTIMIQTPVLVKTPRQTKGALSSLTFIPINLRGEQPAERMHFF